MPTAPAIFGQCGGYYYMAQSLQNALRASQGVVQARLWSKSGWTVSLE